MDLSLRDALLKAIVEDDGPAVTRLMELGAPIGPDPRHGNTPMRTACQEGVLHSIQALLAQGASANERITYRSAVDKRIEQDFTPLFYASSPEAIDLLVKFGADVNAVSATGLSPLMRFSHFGRADLVEALLRHGADVSLRQHPKRGRKARNALQFAQESLAFWESLPKVGLKPEAQAAIEDHRRTVELLVQPCGS